MFFIPKNVKIKSQSLLIIEKRAKYSLGAGDKYCIYDFFQFIMNILVIVFKIEILIYNTQMNSTLRQFMSTGVHWISTGFPLEFHWTSTGLPLEWKSSGLQWTLGGKYYNKIIRLQNSSGIPVNSSGKVVEFHWNSTGKALESMGHRKDLHTLNQQTSLQHCLSLHRSGIVAAATMEWLI